MWSFTLRFFEFAFFLLVVSQLIIFLPSPFTIKILLVRSSVIQEARDGWDLPRMDGFMPLNFPVNGITISSPVLLFRCNLQAFLSEWIEAVSLIILQNNNNNSNRALTKDQSSQAVRGSCHERKVENSSHCGHLPSVRAPRNIREVLWTDPLPPKYKAWDWVPHQLQQLKGRAQTALLCLLFQQQWHHIVDTTTARPWLSRVCLYSLPLTPSDRLHYLMMTTVWESVAWLRGWCLSQHIWTPDHGIGPVLWFRPNHLLSFPGTGVYMFSILLNAVVIASFRQRLDHIFWHGLDSYTPESAPAPGRNVQRSGPLNPCQSGRTEVILTYRGLFKTWTIFIELLTLIPLIRPWPKQLREKRRICMSHMC